MQRIYEYHEQDHNGEFLRLSAQANQVPLISVIMSTYKSASFLQESLISISNQTFGKWELILVLDGASHEEISIAKRQQLNDSRIILILQNNLGLTKALNRAWSAASGKFIARQDADDISHPNRLQAQLNFLLQNPSNILVGTNTKIINSDGYTDHSTRINRPASNIIETLSQGNPITHGSVLMRQTDERYDERFLCSQDFELWQRLKLKGNISILEDQLYSQRVHPNQISQKKSLEQSLYFALIMYREKFGSFPHPWPGSGKTNSREFQEILNRSYCRRGLHSLETSKPISKSSLMCLARRLKQSLSL